MKRSQNIRLILLGGLSAGALSTSTLAAATSPQVTPQSYFTNDVHIPGAGYYHAPYRAFYAHPYNHYDAQRKMYFHGGAWHATKHRSIVNISAPTDDAVKNAQAMRTDVRRGGFGAMSGHHFIPS